MHKYKDMIYSVRPDGYYKKAICLNGKKKYLYAKTPAELYQKWIEAKIWDNKNILIEDNITMEKWAIRWLDIYKSNVEKKTKQMYELAINNYIIPELGLIQLKNIKESDIILLLNKIKDKPRQQEIVLLTLKQIIEKAIDNDYLAKNVARRIKIPKYKPKEKKSLTKEVIEIINQTAKYDECCLRLKCCLYMGLRKEELAGLTWDCFDFQNKTVTIKQAIHWEHNKPEIKHTKNKEIATIPLFDIIYDDLYNRYKQYNKETKIVFPSLSKRNSYMTETSIKRVLEHALRQLNKYRIKNNIEIPEISFSWHILKHTFACLLHKSGIPVKEAQKFTRHKDLNVLLNIYTHLDLNDISNASQKINEFLR